MIIEKLLHEKVQRRYLFIISSEVKDLDVSIPFTADLYKDKVLGYKFSIIICWCLDTTMSLDIAFKHSRPN